jgi:hypothetical protein
MEIYKNLYEIISDLHKYKSIDDKNSINLILKYNTEYSEDFKKTLLTNPELCLKILNPIYI